MHDFESPEIGIRKLLLWVLIDKRWNPVLGGSKSDIFSCTCVLVLFVHPLSKSLLQFLQNSIFNRQHSFAFLYVTLLKHKKYNKSNLPTRYFMHTIIVCLGWFD